MRQINRDRNLDSASLDQLYNYHRGAEIWHIAKEDQKEENGKMELKVGDEILLNSGNFVRNIGNGVNQRTKKTGNYSLDKVRVLTKPIQYLSFI